jgi:hypothetical protein
MRTSDYREENKINLPFPKNAGKLDQGMFLRPGYGRDGELEPLDVKCLLCHMRPVLTVPHMEV